MSEGNIGAFLGFQGALPNCFLVLTFSVQVFPAVFHGMCTRSYSGWVATVIPRCHGLSHSNKAVWLLYSRRSMAVCLVVLPECAEMLLDFPTCPMRRLMDGVQDDSVKNDHGLRGQSICWTTFQYISLCELLESPKTQLKEGL